MIKLLVSLTLACFCAFHTAHAEQAKRNIADYYLALPRSLYENWDSGPTLSLERRKEMIDGAKKNSPESEGSVTLDIRNGYLQVSGSDSGERQLLTMVLFRQKDGSALIAITADENFEQEEENGGGPATGFFGFFILAGEKWSEVTARFAPRWPIKNVYLELPRHGTTIKVYKRGKKQLAASWIKKGDRFESHVE